MPVQWRLAARGAFQAHVAQMEGGYDLSIIGTDDVWRWLVRRGEDDLAEGAERTLTAAKVVATATPIFSARWLPMTGRSSRLMW